MEEQKNAQYYIENLDLIPHIEDGYFKETYRSPTLNQNEKSILSSIYFLIKQGHVTQFRKLNSSDEVVIFQKGKSMEIIMIDLEGKIQIQKIGDNLNKGEKMQAVIPANFIASFKCKKNEETNQANDFCLFACVCGPAFNYEDFKILNIDDIKKDFPNIDLTCLNSYIEDL